MKKSLSVLLATVMLLVFIPAGALTAAADEVFADYYGRAALASLPNGDALVYAYDRIAGGIENAESPIRFSNTAYSFDADELDVVVDAYRRDYSQYFWMGHQYSFYTRGDAVTQMMPQYNFSGNGLDFAKIELEEAADEILAGIDSSMSEFEIELYLHDALAKQVVYTEAQNAHNAYGALVEGKAVCEGYAHAMQYLLHRAGIQSFIAHGSSINPGTGTAEGHAWNYVRIDGEYYHLDLTWNDQESNLYHSYFNLSDRQITADHEIAAASYELPSCTSEQANYFRVAGNYIEEYSVDSIAELLKKNDLSVNLYIAGDVDAFLEWYGENVRTIARKIGLVGAYSYGYASLGNEVHLYLIGNYKPEEPETPEEPEEPAKNGWIKENGKWAYFENNVKVTNKWLKDSQGWCYVGADGYCVTNCWKKDSHGWCYLDQNGRMAVNKWVRDSVGWCYVGKDGYAVTNCWKRDSHGWCYLNGSGSMTKNAWVKDGGKWYFLDKNGYMVSNVWKKDSKGWCYLGSDGAMKTNAWVRDSVGWCYVGEDGYAVTNCWKKDSHGWCYLNGSGSMTKSDWIKEGGKWYYLDANGYMVYGKTLTIDGIKYTFDKNGVLQ